MRGTLYERCLPMATSELAIDAAVHGPDAGLLGRAMPCCAWRPGPTRPAEPGPAAPSHHPSRPPPQGE
ncbi:hypothetical protein PQR15_04805 [Streptomyces lydicus]|nr:hypothetical protein [Streptomyces lydicus]